MVEGTARPFCVSSENGELGLLTGWTGDVLRDGINAGLDHHLWGEGPSLFQRLMNMTDDLPTIQGIDLGKSAARFIRAVVMKPGAPDDLNLRLDRRFLRRKCEFQFQPCPLRKPFAHRKSEAALTDILGLLDRLFRFPPDDSIGHPNGGGSEAEKPSLLLHCGLGYPHTFALASCPVTRSPHVGQNLYS